MKTQSKPNIVPANNMEESKQRYNAIGSGIQKASLKDNLDNVKELLEKSKDIKNIYQIFIQKLNLTEAEIFTQTQ